MRALLMLVLFLTGLFCIVKISSKFEQPIASIMFFSLFALLLFLLNKIKIYKEPEIRTTTASITEKFLTCNGCAKTFYQSDCTQGLCPDCGKPLQQ